MKNRILECYVTTLRRSGYNDNEIKKFATDGIVDYVRRVKREEEGGDPVHRDKVDIKKSTYSKKLTIKTNWYKKENKGYRIKKWGDKVISDRKMGCTSDP